VPCSCHRPGHITAVGAAGLHVVLTSCSWEARIAEEERAIGVILPNVRLRGIAARVLMAPPVSLDPRSQIMLQRAIEERSVELNYIERTTEALELGRKYPNSRELLRALVRPDMLSIEHRFPASDRALVVKEMDEIALAALETLNPAVLGAFHIMLKKEATAPGGDARVYLGDEILQLSEDRKEAFGRPIHTVGVKFFMPPFTVSGEDDKPQIREANAVDVRIESLNENTADLYVECTHQFLEPVVPSAFDGLDRFVKIANEFLDQRVAAFLQIPDKPEEENDG